MTCWLTPYLARLSVSSFEGGGRNLCNYYRSYLLISTLFMMLNGLTLTPLFVCYNDIMKSYIIMKTLLNGFITYGIQ